VGLRDSDCELGEENNPLGDADEDELGSRDENRAESPNWDENRAESPNWGDWQNIGYDHGRLGLRLGLAAEAEAEFPTPDPLLSPTERPISPLDALQTPTAGPNPVEGFYATNTPGRRCVRVTVRVRVKCVRLCVTLDPNPRP